MRVDGPGKLALLALGFSSLMAAAIPVWAERLPLRVYTRADGLVNDRVSRIVRDPRGFLWFCTEGGLSRFDGYAFTNYTTAQGLPSNWVDDLLIARDGTYWIATEGGLCRFNPDAAAGPLFITYRPGPDILNTRVRSLYEDRAGNVWCGTWNNLFRVEMVAGEPRFHLVDLGTPPGKHNRIRNLAEDRHGNLWAGADRGLYRVSPDGSVTQFTTAQGLPGNNIMGLLVDREGNVWAGESAGGLCRIIPDAGPEGPVVARCYAARERQCFGRVSALFEAADGRFWVGMACALSEFLPAAGVYQYFTSTETLKDLQVWGMAEDSEGNLWAGTPGGAVRVSLTGFVTYTEADGLGQRNVYSLTESRVGELLVGSGPSQDEMLNTFDGRRFATLRLGGALQDRAGEWWVPTERGLYRFARTDRVRDLAGMRPRAVYTRRDGLPSDTVSGIYEDARGDLWVLTGSADRAVNLTRRERATGRFHVYSDRDGLPPDGREVYGAFCDDRAGNLWVGFKKGGVARYRDGRFQFFAAADGLPAGNIRDLLLDREGRLWVATDEGGVARVDDPAADPPRFTRLTTAEGLSSNDARCLVEDRFGRIYVGTMGGLDRLDPATGSVKHYTLADGLANQLVEYAFCDRQGVLWFGTTNGLSRLLPGPEPPRPPVRALIAGLRVNGVTRALSPLGVAEVAAFELRPGQNNIAIDFLGVSFRESPRYQYKLEGGAGDWSAPSQQRTVDYPNLPPGTYRFLVRAVNAEGAPSPHLASVAFTILPPVWQRWWFLTFAAVAATLVIYALYRYQLGQQLKVERVRTRIATDLHDDIGANLSLIAMASEVARRRSREDDRQVTEALSLISGTSRELVDSMGDIVWAINPNRDRLVDLIKRMRRFASDLFAARGIAFRFEAPADERDIHLGTETRREVLLIFKEAVNNIARHSGCAEADIELKAQGGWLVLKLSDNGKGFDTSRSFDGNGLVSMGQRAARLGGRLEVISRNGDGTTVTLKTPLK